MINKMKKDIPIAILPLFPVLDRLLIQLLKSLKEEEWHRQTVAKLWTVKDVASHLLDGNLKGLSMARDGYFGEKRDSINSYEALVGHINQMNMTWTHATKRLSPQVITNLLESTGREYIEQLQSLDPKEQAIFSVAWAGQETSENWFHIAREYTEKFLHQQQIRDAVGHQGIMTKELFYPFLDTLMYAFPPTFKQVPAPEQTVVSLRISTDIGGRWDIIKIADRWELSKGQTLKASSLVTMDPDTAWKLFSRSCKPEQVMDKVEMIGDRNLGEKVLEIVSFMA